MGEQQMQSALFMTAYLVIGVVLVTRMGGSYNNGTPAVKFVTPAFWKSPTYSAINKARNILPDADGTTYIYAVLLPVLSIVWGLYSLQQRSK